MKGYYVLFSAKDHCYHVLGPDGWDIDNYVSPSRSEAVDYCEILNNALALKS